MESIYEVFFSQPHLRITCFTRDNSATSHYADRHNVDRRTAQGLSFHRLARDPVSIVSNQSAQQCHADCLNITPHGFLSREANQTRPRA
jgi:hypothetical protein